MKRSNLVIKTMLNVLFCMVALWFFARNSYLRPFSGSYVKEVVSGLLLIGTLYVNYFLLYPKLHAKHRQLYWLILMLVAIIISVADLAIAYPFISSCNAQLIAIIGPYMFFSRILFFTIWRNLALNFFPFLLNERKHYLRSFENEERIVYQEVRKLDVTDRENNIHLVAIEDIFFCYQQRNFTEIHTIQNETYSRLGSMKHLEQLFGDEFVRISSTTLLPVRYIEECKGDIVIMKVMSWENESTSFKLGTNNQENIVKQISEKIQNCQVSKPVFQKKPLSKVKRKPIVPPDNKIREVLSYIENNPNCNSADIIASTQYSLSTVERCLFELKKQGLIIHNGSKKNGGYQVCKKRK